MKNIKYLTYVVVAIIIIFLLSRAGIIAVDGGSYSDKKDSPQLKNNQEIGQSFYAPNGVSAIGIKLNTYDMRNAGVLMLKVFKKRGGKKIAEVIRDDPTFPNGETVVFSFSRLPRGRYYFEVSDKGYKGMAPSLKMAGKDNYKYGAAYTGENGNSDLWFQVYRRYSFFSFLGLISTRLSTDWFKFIPKTVYILLFGAYIALAIALAGYAVNMRFEFYRTKETD